MALKTLDGTKVRSGIYHLNLRIPADVSAAFGGKTHLRRSLKTSDRKTAEDAVTVARAEIITAVENTRRRDTLAEAVAALPPEQRDLYTRAGGLSGLLKSFTQESDWLRRENERPDTVIADDLTAYERFIEDEAAPERAREVSATESRVTSRGKTLKALGEPVKFKNAFGLRELVDVFAKAKGTGGQTADAMRGIAARFTELHGDLALADLTITHLREYADAAKGLPAVSAGKALHGKNLQDLLKITAAKQLPTIGDATRARHIAMLKALTAFAPSQGYLTADPWAAFKLILPKTKHSTQKPRAPFSAPQVKALLADALTFPAQTVDRWAPMLAAYQGARREEIGQLRGCDVFQIGGVWVMRVTDEGEDQKVKNAASFRTIPLHQTVIDAGFTDFTTTRSADAFLFTEANRWGGERGIEPDRRGRLTEGYGKRFSKRLRGKMKITDPRLTFHSFRHRWEDAAEDTEMQQTHRRDLAGRSRADSQAGYGDGPKMVALKRSLDRVDPAAD